MSFDHFFQYPSSNDTDADAMNAEQRRGRRDLFITPIPMFTPDPTFAPDTFFAPDPQLADAPSPETFDLEVDNNKEVEGFDLESSLRQFDDLFATFRDTVPVVPTPSVVTYSTESTYDVSSQYSCDLTLSDYSIPSDIGSRGSVSDSFSPPTSFYSATFSDFSPSIPPLSTSKAVAGQGLAAVSPSAAVHVALDETQGPMPFKCTYPQCSFSSERSYNLNTHISAVHHKLQPFKCSTCNRTFSRKHDLKRHCKSKHEGRMSPSPSLSGDPMPNWLDVSRNVALNEGRMPISSPYPDQFLNFDAAIDVPENIIPWVQGV